MKNEKRISKEPPDMDRAKGWPVFQAILSRRDSRQFESREVESKIIEDILYAATWAPNHRLTEPWRFAVVKQEDRSGFIEAYTQAALSLAGDGDREKMAKKAETSRLEMANIPLFIAVASQGHENPEVDFENVLATACAIQNMLLAAEERGISAHWSTGKTVKTERFHQYFGFQKDMRVTGLFSMGYPLNKNKMKRIPARRFISWNRNEGFLTTDE